jgi:hypothetical protein
MPKKEQHDREDDEELHAMGNAKSDHLLVNLTLVDHRGEVSATPVLTSDFRQDGGRRPQTLATFLGR